jgi:hypothetical protein
MLDGQYEDVVRIIAVNTDEGWSRDVTEEIASELRETCSERGEMPNSIEDFIREHATVELPASSVFNFSGFAKCPGLMQIKTYSRTCPTDVMGHIAGGPEHGLAFKPPNRPTRGRAPNRNRLHLADVK